MKFKNFPMVPFVIYGRGSSKQLEEIINPHRKEGKPMIYLVDHFFKEKALSKNIPLQGKDKIIFIDTTDEPETKVVDQIRDGLKAEYGEISGIIGFGGGSVLDMTKAVALMMTNPGSSADYQGWDLIKKKGVYHVGIPTLSGTGSEVSRTCVLTGPEKKLGINSDFTPFDQVILDPDLIKGAPKNQRFYTGMDCFIHCVESLEGTYLNAFSKAYGEKAYELCEGVFLHKDEWDDASDEALMMASWHGGMSIAYSQVGVAHAMSYGLAYVLGVHHGIGNCIVFNHLDEFYREGVYNFKKMVDKSEIHIPKNLCAELSDEQMDIMITISQGMVPLWENALGKDWRKTATREKLRELYLKM